MSRRILSVVVTVLGLVLVALAVCSATIWKPGSKVEAKLASGPSQPYVITAPGVLSGAESDVTVTASSSDGKDVHLFVARAADLDAWMSPDANNALPYTAVTSIDADAGTLASKDETQYCPPANAAPAPSAAPSAQPSASAQAGGSKCSERKAKGVTASGSDIWLGEKTGGSSVTFNTGKDADRAMLPHKNLDEQIVVMAMTDGKASAPGLTISWKRQVETPWYFYGGLVLGSVFVLVGAFLFFIDLQLRRANVDRRTRSAERAARIANADSVSTEGIPQVDDPDRRLTRRELRDKERAEASAPAAALTAPAGAEYPGASTSAPLKGVRKVVAKRMMESLTSTAQLTLNTTANAAGILAMRKKVKNADGSLGLNKITLNDLVCFAVSRTLPKYPVFNAHLEDGVLTQFEQVHLGFACDTPRGLLVPVIRSAQALGLKAFSDEAKRLAGGAIDGSLSPDFLSGGTFTVSNIGSFGIETFTPVINLPQTAILGVGAITPRPVVAADGSIGVEQRLNLSLTIDHQVIDGADGARFLRDLVAAIENIDVTVLA